VLHVPERKEVCKVSRSITPFLWFDNQAEEAVAFYRSIFKNAKILDERRYTEAGPGPAGSVMTISFRLGDLELAALNGGPHYHFTPATSFFVRCETLVETDKLWARLAEGGNVLMALDAFPFSDRFGWLNDRYGVSWQVSHTGTPQSVCPFLMFAGDMQGKAEEAIGFYTSLFEDSKVYLIERYGAGDVETEGSVKHAWFSLRGQEFMAIDSGRAHAFSFSPAVSFFIPCESQSEVDHLWSKLEDGGAPNQCGWIDDRFGVTWQVVPIQLLEMLGDKDVERVKRVYEAMFAMSKIEIAELRAAYNKA
jgi:predicted 3-demethylubiquinone-9 3-methyltransferase (glyoxalase superfamily)